MQENAENLFQKIWERENWSWYLDNFKGYWYFFNVTQLYWYVHSSSILDFCMADNIEVFSSGIWWDLQKVTLIGQAWQKSQYIIIKKKIIIISYLPFALTLYLYFIFRQKVEHDRGGRKVNTLYYGCFCTAWRYSLGEILIWFTDFSFSNPSSWTRKSNLFLGCLVSCFLQSHCL